MQFLSFEGGVRVVCAWLCQFIYKIIAFLYELFMNISKVELLSSDDIMPIYQRITLILSIIMVFYVTFEFVKFIVEPKNITNEEKGVQNIVKKMIIVVVLIAFVPRIFSLAYRVQNLIFKNQLFSKIILGKQDVEVSQYGRDFSANFLSMFYYIDDSIEWENSNKGKDCDELECKQIVALNINTLREQGTLPYITMGIEEEDKAKSSKTEESVKEFKIHFDGMFAIVVGGFIAYMLALYCIDAGVRVVQLAYLQIIAPIPIIGYLSPKKDGIFQKWVKQCWTTYLDLFIRVGIIYLVMLIVEILPKALDNISNQGLSKEMNTFMYIAIVMGLLLFAKKAPKMLEELFPKMGAASGNFGLKAGERVAPIAARAIGVAAGSTKLIGGAARRIRAANIRNKANGTNTRTGRKKNREELRAARRNKESLEKATKANAAARKEHEKNDAANGRNELNEKNKKFEEAQKANKDYQAAKANYDKIKNDSTKTVAEKEAARIAMEKAHQTAKDKAAEYGTASKAYANTNYGKQEKEEILSKAKERDLAKQDSQKAHTDLTDAETEMNNILNNPASTDEEKAAAIEKYNKAKEVADKSDERLTNATNNLHNSGKTVDREHQFKDNIEYVHQTYNPVTNTIENEKRTVNPNEVDTIMQNLTDETIAKSNAHQSIAGATAFGALNGATIGIREGAKTTKLEDLHKNMQSARNASVKQQQEINKYYDSGGAGGFEGFVDRTRATVDKKYGFDTQYDIRNLEAKAHESEIKAQEAASKAADSSVASIDGFISSAKSNLVKTDAKVDKNSSLATSKLKASMDTFEKYGIKCDGDSVKDVYEKTKQAAQDIASKNKKAQEDAAQSKSNLGLDTANSAEKSAADIINGNMTTSEKKNALAAITGLDPSKRSAIDAYIAKQEEADSASEAQREVEDAMPKIEKGLAEYQENVLLSKYYRGEPLKLSEVKGFDDEVVIKFNEEIKALQSYRNNPELSSSLRQLLTPELYQRFVSGNYVGAKYDDLNAIKTACKEASQQAKGIASDYQEQQNAIERSKETKAQHAAADYNGNQSGGK